MPWYHIQFIGLVALGGAIGSLLRYAVSLAFPTSMSFIATFLVNVIGCFALGYLVEALTRHWPLESTRSQRIRLFLGTGLCGGFTTYSTFALDAHNLLAPAGAAFGARSLAIGLAYLAGTLVFGWLAALAGVALGARRWTAIIGWPSCWSPSEAGLVQQPGTPCQVQWLGDYGLRHRPKNLQCRGAPSALTFLAHCWLGCWLRPHRGNRWQGCC